MSVTKWKMFFDIACPNSWISFKVYSTMIRYGTITPAIFLSSIKKHFPEHFLRSVEIVGERIWERKQLVHKGAHLFQCSREAGLSFKDSDEIISRLSHVDSRQLLHENSQEALQLGVLNC
ncbi:hypothetical protein COOONC_04456 [Cooperia oncophora]